MKSLGLNQQLEYVLEKKFKKFGKDAIWDTVRAPEYMTYWSTQKEWPGDFYKSFGTYLEMIHFNAANAETTESKTYSKKTPFYTADQRIDYMTYTAKTNTTAAINLKFENILHLNKIMGEVSDTLSIGQWKVHHLHLLLDDMRVEFRHFNPDGNGAFLYFYRLIIKDKNTFYPDVPIERQWEICRGFADGSAHCHVELETDKQYSTTCVLKYAS